ncbi:MAG: hypothetical protein RBS17_04405 [Coriobacteriia bacterium]|nr:hypothetical protein [Coriobacteriia bacterium]
MRRPLAVLLLAVLTFAVMSLAAGCACSADTQEQQMDGPSPVDKGGDKVMSPTLEQFLDASKKTGEFSLFGTMPNGTTYDYTGEFWVDGDLFRFDLYEDDELVRSIMSPDGSTAYFVQYAEEISQPSVASVARYLEEFDEPGESAAEDGIDEETGATRVVYTLQRADTMEGAANPWYVEDITYLVLDDTVIGVISRGAAPEEDGSVGELEVSRRLFSNVEVGADIDPALFELPFPVQDAL